MHFQQYAWYVEVNFKGKRKHNCLPSESDLYAPMSAQISSEDIKTFEQSEGKA